MADSRPSQGKWTNISLTVWQRRHLARWACDDLEQAWLYVKSLTDDTYDDGVPDTIWSGTRRLYRLKEEAGSDRWLRVDDSAPAIPEEFSS